jgi:hypothetical protein
MTTRFAEPMSRLIRPAARLPRPSIERRRRQGARPRYRATETTPSTLLHLQQHHRRRPLHLLHEPHAQPASDLRPRRAHQHRHHREDPRLQRRLPRPARHSVADQRSRPGATTHRQSADPRRQSLRGRRDHSRDFTDHRRRSHRQLHRARTSSDFARRGEPSPEHYTYRHRCPRRLRHRVRRRSHHLPRHGTSPGPVASLPSFSTEPIIPPLRTV